MEFMTQGGQKSFQCDEVVVSKSGEEVVVTMKSQTTVIDQVILIHQLECEATY